MSRPPARIRVVGGPWPERIGCEGVIAEPPADWDGKQYPWGGRGKNEVIILLDDDPLTRGRRRAEHDVWTCAIDRADVAVS